MSPHRTDEPEASGSDERSPSGRSNSNPPTNRYGSGGSGGYNLPGGGDAANRILAFDEAGYLGGLVPHLWAHQLRRDLAHSERNNEQTQARLASALGATSQLQQAVTQLSELVQHLHEENQRLRETMRILNQRLVNKQDELDATVETHFSLIDSWSLRINSLEARMSGVENFCARIIARDETNESVVAAMRERLDEIQRLRMVMEEHQSDEEVNENYSGCSSVESICGSDHPLLSVNDRATPSIDESCTQYDGPTVTTNVESVDTGADAEVTRPERTRRTIPIIPPDEEDMDLSKS